MTELRRQDLHWILRRLPTQVVKVLKEYPGKVFLAGGFIRACVANEQVADIDLFAPTKEMADLISFKLEGHSRYVTQNAVTIRWAGLTPPVQVIHRWTYERPADLIESFDFTVAKAVVWFQADAETVKGGWFSLCHDDFYADLAAKRLVYTKPQRNEDAGGSLLRVLKFYQKGYLSPLDSMGAVVARLLNGVDLKRLDNPNLGATREEALGAIVTGLLREVDPLQDPQHLFHLPSDAEVAESGRAEEAAA